MEANNLDKKTVKERRDIDSLGATVEYVEDGIEYAVFG